MSLHCGSVFSRLSKRSAIRYHMTKLRKIASGSSLYQSRLLVAKISHVASGSDVGPWRHPTGCVTVGERSCASDPRTELRLVLYNAKFETCQQEARSCRCNVATLRVSPMRRVLRLPTARCQQLSGSGYYQQARMHGTRGTYQYLDVSKGICCSL